MSRPSSVLSPGRREPGASPANRVVDPGRRPVEDAPDAGSSLAEIVGRDMGSLSIERLVPDNARIMHLLSSSQYGDIDIRRITELLESG
jgi:hypothetical protein